MKTKSGILLTNIGSPDQATPRAVRAYLKKFLSDRRVVQIPRILWYPILYGLILPFRSHSSAKLYQKIWTDKGSPLTLNSLQLVEKLQKQLNIPVAVGMHYGNPSIQCALEKLRAEQVENIFILPLFPQYSVTSTAVTFDCVAEVFKSWCNLPSISMLHDYASHPDYIQALCHSIQSAWEKQNKPQHLLFSFHGLPERLVNLGDPYQSQCLLTARLVADKLNLTTQEWSVAFQSRINKGKWLTPYTDRVLQELPNQGVQSVHVICPGFAVDCLETLEEIAIRGKEQFLQAGGKEFYYIPALNDKEIHVNALINIMNHCKFLL